VVNPHVLRCFLRWSLTEVPSLYRSYPASSVIRTSPPPHTDRPVSHELSVDRTAITAGASRVAAGLLCLHAVAITPAGPMKFVRSSTSIVGGLPRDKVGSAPAIVFSGPAQRSLKLRPARSRSRHGDPFHRRLQQFRCLHCCSDCYRVKRTSSRAGVSPAEVQRLFTAHFIANHIPYNTDVIGRRQLTPVFLLVLSGVLQSQEIKQIRVTVEIQPASAEC
jgi:AraC-like DNA-binding protein